MDLVLHYRLLTTDPANHSGIIDVIAGQFAEAEKPQMQTEAARKIPVPTWWSGTTTLSDATMLIDKVRRRDQ